LSVLEEDLKFILQKNPDNADALNALGYTLTDRTNRHEEALVLIQKAVELVPNNAYFLDSLGWVYYRLGDLEKAEKYLRDAIAIQDDAEFLAHLGEVLWNQDRHAEAKKVWADAKQVAADNKILIETMSRYGQ
jgi:tetratricopeptide (TPR) repeat protein